MIRRITSAYKAWKMRRIARKLARMFHDLRCDEVWYSKYNERLYVIRWTGPHTLIEEIPKTKRIRRDLIAKYKELVGEDDE